MLKQYVFTWLFHMHRIAQTWTRQAYCEFQLLSTPGRQRYKKQQSMTTARSYRPSSRAVPCKATRRSYNMQKPDNMDVCTYFNLLTYINLNSQRHQPVLAQKCTHATPLEWISWVFNPVNIPRMSSFFESTKKRAMGHWAEMENIHAINIKSTMAMANLQAKGGTKNLQANGGTVIRF